MGFTAQHSMSFLTCHAYCGRGGFPKICSPAYPPCTPPQHAHAAGEEAEEAEAEDREVEDIFELEGMSELDINADPETLARMQAQREAAAAGPRGGWEGQAGSVAAAAAAEAAAAANANKPAVDEVANKLDSMMEITFAHLDRRLAQAGGPLQVWEALLAIFERTILNTHRSKFSQFLVFYVAYKHHSPCAQLFVDFLLARLQVRVGRG